MYSYKGRNNNIYHFNGDCSGDLIITESVDGELKNEMRIDFQDVIDILKDNGYSITLQESIDKMIKDIEVEIETSKRCIDRYEIEGVTEIPFMLPKAVYQIRLGKSKKELERIEKYINK